jgi:hypothetical protein
MEGRFEMGRREVSAIDFVSSRLSLGAALALLALTVAACGQGNAEAVQPDRPATVRHVDGSDVAAVTLTPQAADRIGLETAAVRVDGARRLVPYSAVLYDGSGGAWVYTNPEGLTFVRSKVAIATIEGDIAYLSDGPAAGMTVVKVGVAELFGAEMGVGDPE